MTRAWSVTGASRTGASHTRTGRPNQDAVGWTPREGAGARVIAAVSDGHGAALHFRSERGARFAVETALELLGWHADEAGAPVAALPADLLEAWRARVLADMALDPVRCEDVPGATLSPYGATLVALAADDSGMTVLQIGDGDLLLVDGEGGVSRPLGSDAGLIGEQTYSLCQDDAVGRFRVARVSLDGSSAPVAALLATDGVAKSFRDADTFEEAARHLAARGRVALDRLAAELPDWLDRLSRHGSGDDASLCLVLAPDTHCHGDAA